ncbi:MAG: hypothetical protein H6865_06530 [Rhodospirillales bacterium]|nr:hypothetical protein [Alphaproteobacteria bacterium]MCB9987277.1 hypothetical protein [Rhodospirillales bacterium]USO07866.1 MAG: hypothetical protein H6866_01170 [Rhodospirillales bacterium]
MNHNDDHNDGKSADRKERQETHERDTKDLARADALRANLARRKAQSRERARKTGETPDKTRG